jgi:pyrophosphatase PpaX
VKRLKAVLFDIDGTLLDSAEFIYRAFAHVLRERKLPPRSRADMAAVMGVSLEECYRVLAGGGDLEAMCREHRAFQRQHLDLPRAFPGAIEVLEELARMGLRMAAVTTRSRISSLTTLERCGLARFMQTVMSAEDTPNLKPHPEPLRKALAVLKVKPAQAVMVGDTEADVQAGRSAGTLTVGAVYGFQGAAVQRCNPDYVIRSIRELPAVLARIGARGAARLP